MIPKNGRLIIIKIQPQTCFFNFHKLRKVLSGQRDPQRLVPRRPEEDFQLLPG
jgi:hypothetical protein